MPVIHDDAVRTETIAVLDAIEIGVSGLRHIFQAVASGTPLDAQRAQILDVQCAELVKSIADTRNAIRLSAPTEGVQ